VGVVCKFFIKPDQDPGQILIGRWKIFRRGEVQYYISVDRGSPLRDYTCSNQKLTNYEGVIRNKEDRFVFLVGGMRSA
jgi:hypothetical protein